MSKKILLISLSTLLSGVAIAADPVELSVKVEDERGKPVAGAEVKATFQAYVRTNNVIKSGLTDESGEVSISGFPNAKYLANIMGVVNKKGYYPTTIPNLGYTKKAYSANVILRSIGEPKPLFARKVVIVIPGLEGEYGYDLGKASWVAPHGNGENADLVISTVEKQVISRNDWEVSVKLSFPNVHSGIQKITNEYKYSEFSTVRIAPEDGYNNAVVLRRESQPGKGYKGTPAATQYVLKTRHSAENEGARASSCYAKIGPGLRILPGVSQKDKAPGLSFTYYFNPTPNDRNLEFDPKQNLFKDLKFEEQVREP